MTEIDDIKDGESLEAWLNETGQSRENCIALAHRAAMRVAPLAWEDLAPGNKNYELTGWSMCLSLLVSGVATQVPTPEIKGAAQATQLLFELSPLGAGLKADAFNTPAGPALGAVRDALATVIKDAFVREAIDTMNFAAFAMNGARPLASFPVATSKDAWDRLREDCRLLENERRIPITMPLWGNELTLFSDEWKRIASRWRHASGAWDFWADWYEGALAGKPLDIELLTKIALISPELEIGQEDVLNDRIRDIRTSYSSKPPDASQLEYRLRQVERGLSEAKAALDDINGAIAGAEHRKESLASQLEALERAITAAQGTLAEMEAKSIARREELLEAFQTELEAKLTAATNARALEDPVKLWEAKEKEHGELRDDAYRWFLRSLGVVGGLIVAFVLLILASPQTLSAALAPPGCDLETSTAGCPGFSFKGLLVTTSILTLFTLAFWIVRLKMKEYLAERHLMLDARERRAFAQAYLALLAIGDASAEAKEQRGLVYAALFRHGSDGIIADDGGLDPSIASVASKVLTRN